MYKYTASPSVLHKYDSIKRNSKRYWDDHFFLAKHICGSSDAYFACGNFWRNYKSIQFYSEKRVKHVPVNGVYISVEWFLETEVE